MYIASNTPGSFKDRAGFAYIKLGERIDDTGMAVIMLDDSYNLRSIPKIEALTAMISKYPLGIPIYLVGLELLSKESSVSIEIKDSSREPLRRFCIELLSRSNSMGVRGDETRDFLIDQLGLTFNQITTIYSNHLISDEIALDAFISFNDNKLRDLFDSLLEFQMKPTMQPEIRNLKSIWLFEDMDPLTQLTSTARELGSPFEPFGPLTGSVVDAAIVALARNEDRFIGGWLRYHYFLGFRRFVLIDHLSTDDTVNNALKVSKQLHDLELVVIHEECEDYRQQEFTTGAARYAMERWPNANWVFALDLDEYLSVTQDISTLLKRLEGSDSLRIRMINHHSELTLNKALSIRNEEPDMSVSDYAPGEEWIEGFSQSILTDQYKVVLSRSALKDTGFAQGNHFPRGPSGKVNVSGLVVGIIIRHFPNRDYPSFLSKVKSAVQSGYADPSRYRSGGNHWESWAVLLVTKGEAALLNLWIDIQKSRLHSSLRESVNAIEQAQTALGGDSE